MSNQFRNYIAGQWVESQIREDLPEYQPREHRRKSWELSRLPARKMCRRHVKRPRRRNQPGAPRPRRAGASISSKRRNSWRAASRKISEEMTREEGKTLPEAKGEVKRAINILRYFGGEGARQFSYQIPSERDNVFCYTLRKPLGVVALITPWNFPSAIPVWKMAPALVAGNTVVIKPASLAPLSGYELLRRCTKRESPPGW